MCVYVSYIIVYLCVNVDGMVISILHAYAYVKYVSYGFITIYGLAIYIHIIGWVEMGPVGWTVVSGWFTADGQTSWSDACGKMILCIEVKTHEMQKNKNHKFHGKAAYGRNWQDHFHTTLRAWFGSCFPTSTMFFEWRWYWTQRSCVSLGCALVKFVSENFWICLLIFCWFYAPTPFRLDPQNLAKKSREINRICVHHAALQPLKVLSFTCSLYSWHVWIPPLTAYIWWGQMLTS